MKKVLFWFVQCTWGIIQTIIGLLVWFVICTRAKDDIMVGHTHALVVGGNLGAVSIGPCISVFVERPTESLLKHEYGHCIQSLILGPFWLFVIGIPSFVWAGCFAKYRQTHNVSYYSFYTEKWANKLGGIE